MQVFEFHPGSTPLLVSIPHCGTAIPADMLSDMTPAAAELARAAAEYGIDFVHFPVAAAAIGGEAAKALMTACDDLQRPLFVCGRSGGHSTRVWESAEPA